MNSKKTNPFVGLSHISKEECAGIGIFDLLDLVEKEAPSYQEGETRDMFLFLYFIRLLMKANVDFVVQGGILLASVLNDHSRRTHDIDIIVKDPDKFYADVQNAISRNDSEIDFEVSYKKKKEATEWYYKNTFAFRINVYHNQDMINMLVLDGVYGDCYDEIEKVKYRGPKIIDEDFCFYGVDIEYVTGEKILAVSSELPRPVKHLVDLYSLTKIEHDLDKLKAFLKSGLTRENQMRKKFGKPELQDDYTIKADKQFLGNYVYEVLSSGYQLGFKEMKEEINVWIKAVL